MRYQVPQFIELETKLIGPLTLKQFLYIASGVVMLFLIFLLTKGGFIFIVFALPIGGLSAALAFIKVDGAPLIQYLASALSYSVNQKRYLFQKLKTSGQEGQNFGSY